MIPQMDLVLHGWTAPTDMKIIKKGTSDFELVETTKEVLTFEALLYIGESQKIDRQNIGQRNWMPWSMLTTQDLQLDDMVQDPENRIFRVDSKKDWRKAGFFEYDLEEQAPGV